MEKILSVGLPEFKSQYDLTDLDSSVRLNDYELVIFDSLHYLRNILPKNSDYLKAEVTEKVNAHMKRRSSEIWSFVENGGMVIYFPHSKLEYRGYLNNSLKTLSFGDMIFEKNLTPSVGQKLNVLNKINEHIRNFLSALQGTLIHRVILPNYAEYEACLESKDQGQIVGSYKLHESGGAIIILPTLSFSNEENIQAFIDAAKKLRANIPSNRLFKLPEIKLQANQKPELTSKQEVMIKPKHEVTEVKIIKDELVINSLAVTLPEWHADYLLPAQKKIADSIVSLKEEINNLQAMLQAKKSELVELNEYKLLVTAQGATLEKTVATVLSDIGFKLLEGSGKGDLIVGFKEQIFIIEVRGRENKGAQEADAASLEKRTAKHFEDTGKLAKAILIVNGFSELTLSTRPQDIFTQSTIKYSTQREHCLLSGFQLLCLYGEYTKSPDKQSLIVDKLAKCVGLLTDYTDNNWKDILTVLTPEDTVAIT